MTNNKEYMIKNRHNSGFSMIEVLISVLLVTIVASASLTLHYNSFRLADKASQETQAYYLANSGVEMVRLVVASKKNQASWWKFPPNPNPPIYLIINHWYGISEEYISTGQFGSKISQVFTSDFNVTLYGNRYLRFVKMEPVFDNNNWKVTSGVCYGSAAVSRSKCEAAILDKKDYVETVAVVQKGYAR